MWFSRKIFKLEYLTNRESFLRTSNAESTARVSQAVTGCHRLSQAVTGQRMTQLTSNHVHGQTEDDGRGLR